MMGTARRAGYTSRHHPVGIVEVPVVTARQARVSFVLIRCSLQVLRQFQALHAEVVLLQATLAQYRVSRGSRHGWSNANSSTRRVTNPSHTSRRESLMYWRVPLDKRSSWWRSPQAPSRM